MGESVKLPSQADRRRRAAMGWAARHAGLSPEERQAKINAQCALARAAKGPGKPRLPRSGEDAPVDIPPDAFTASPDSGTWEVIGEDPEA